MKTSVLYREKCVQISFWSARAKRSKLTEILVNITTVLNHICFLPYNCTLTAVPSFYICTETLDPFSSASTGGLLSWYYVYPMERHIFAAENSWNCGDERETERRTRVEIVGVCVRPCLLHRVSAYMFVYIYIFIYIYSCMCTHICLYTHTACCYLKLMWSLGQMKCFRDPWVGRIFPRANIWVILL